MLKLVHIKKDYVVNGMPTVHALKDITLSFRRNEFVAILGQSGCGKTTLLNIVGGLDRYTDGDLIIEGKSTKQYNDRDWDTYRNHSIGFVFQSYNLITHINVLSNVELALTISGVSKKERKARAMEALKTVGLEGMEKKKPNQLSGGQMQRVAIARALVNNPEILLADEPTGALDSETSVQIMDLLKEVAKDRLVIMVTHNPDLANQYANRIIYAKDGLIIDDSHPYIGETDAQREKAQEERQAKLLAARKKLASMSFITALGLSLNNMMTKKWRTFLTAFAGSIGIIGIALILSVSYGFDGYIGKVQEDALTSYPMQVSKSSISATSALTTLLGLTSSSASKTEDGSVGLNDAMTNLVTKLVNSIDKSNVKGLKEYIEDPDVINRYKDYLSGISYTYNTDFTTYTAFEDKPIKQAYPADIHVVDDACFDPTISAVYKDTMKSIFDYTANLLEDYFTNSMFPTFSEMIPNIDPETKGEREYSDILAKQYDVVYGRLPDESDEVVLILDENNNINDFLLYSLGLRNPQNLVIKMSKGLAKTYNVPVDVINKVSLLEEEYDFPMSYEDICKCKYYLPVSYQLYDPDPDNVTEVAKEKLERLHYTKKSNTDIATFLESSSTDPDSENYVMKLNITGIVRAKKGVTSTSLAGAIGYLPSLNSDYFIARTNSAPEEGYYSKLENNVVLGQKALKETYDVLADQPFKVDATEQKINATNKVYQLTQADIEELGLPAMIASMFKGYSVLGSTNIVKNTFKFNFNGVDYVDKPLFGNTGNIVQADDQSVSIGNISYDSGIVLISSSYAGEIDPDGTVVTVSFDYVHQVQNSLASTYSKNARKLGICNIDDPQAINFFPKDFESKKYVNKLIDEFNALQEYEVRKSHEGEEIPEETLKQEIEQRQVTVNDSVGTLMNSVQTIVNSVSYVLIAFVSISLIVSSIMIAIITYVSVLERTKEIGILRSLGARKKDIANVFNAETLMIGFTAGLFGVLVALLLDIPITSIITSLANITLTVVVPWYGILALPAISIVLTVISGLIPSIMASKKDPVIALRTE